MIRKAPQFLRAMPVLDCTDMGESLSFYRDKLGFSAATWGDPPSFAIVQRGTVTRALTLVEKGRAAVSRTWAAYIYVRDIDALHAELEAHGVTLFDPPTTTQPHNCRDFVAQDPDGHILSFGQVMAPDAPGPGLSARIGRDAGEGAAP
jgi:predicted enzyme related to lactoylglutathione lyase